MKWRDRKVETVRMRVGDIQPHPMNPKIHPAGQLAPLRGLLETVGKLDDLKAYRSERAGGALVFFDGHGRQSLDPEAEWDVDIYDLTDAEADLAVATFDPIGWQAEQSRAQLDALLREVSTGDAALQKLLSDVAEESGLYFGNEPQAPGAGGDEFDATPEETQTRVKYGDLWQCGEHRVLCGDSTKAEDVGRVMVGETLDAMITDPPYGIGVDKSMHEKGGQQYGKAAAPKRHYEATDWDSEPPSKEAIDYLVSLAPTAVIWGGNYFHLQPARCWLIWDKQNDGNQFADCEMAWTNLDKPVRLIRHMWNGMLRADKEPRNCHPTQKPLGVMVWVIEQVGEHCKAIADFYGGSGTTLIACERTNRKARLIEIEPKYVNVILSRWEAESGKQAKLLERVT